MLDLWVELQKVRKQFADLKVKTEHDLDSQRNEFNKMYRNIQGITRTLSDVSNFGRDLKVIKNFRAIYTRLFTMVLQVETDLVGEQQLTTTIRF